MTFAAAEPAPNPEAALLNRARAGDKGAFVILLKTHDSATRAVAFSVTMDRDVMDDVLQESFLKAYRYLPKLPADTNFRAWLCRIVRNTAIDEVRRRRVVVPFNNDLHGDALGHTSASADRVATGLMVNAALALLPEAQRVAVRLVDGEQLPYDEVASILEIPVGTVASRVNAGRTALRTHITAALKDS